ncbi:hypothetical protein B0H11DRAFT_2224644 [Mycena galericulata]|nr:hypothetical protein B0H11DRAFT_2224644 [Mycena galericulata]
MAVENRRKPFAEIGNEVTPNISESTVRRYIEQVLEGPRSLTPIGQDPHMAEETLHLHFPPHPATSPDVSPIEPVWPLLKKGLRAYQPRPSTYGQLCAVILDVWSQISTDEIDVYIDTSESSVLKGPVAGSTAQEFDARLSVPSMSESEIIPSLRAPTNRNSDKMSRPAAATEGNSEKTVRQKAPTEHNNT